MIEAGIVPGTPRVCVVGAGAMGSLVAAGMLRAGAEVTLVDVGERLARLRSDGLTLVSPDGETHRFGRVVAVEPTEAAGDFDFVFLAVKAYHLTEVAPRLPGLLGTGAALVTLQNGIPWWYFHRFEGALRDFRLATVDPDGALARHVDGDRVIACVPYPAAEVLEDGAVKHVEGAKLPVGELDGSRTARVERLSALLEAGGFRSRILDDVRSETWLKAWGNLAFNPISALTGATLEQLCLFEPTRRLAADMMRESQRVAEALGASFRVGIEQRIAGAQAVGAHKTSMLQDLEAGRRLETDALVGTVLELAEALEIDAPSIRAVYAAVRLLEVSRGVGPGDETSDAARFAGLAAAPASLAG
jgi:2-dehydropantoate 2-reductase